MRPQCEASKAGGLGQPHGDSEWCNMPLLVCLKVNLICQQTAKN